MFVTVDLIDDNYDDFELQSDFMSSQSDCGNHELLDEVGSTGDVNQLNLDEFQNLRLIHRKNTTIAISQ